MINVKVVQHNQIQPNGDLYLQHHHGEKQHQIGAGDQRYYHNGVMVDMGSGDTNCNYNVTHRAQDQPRPRPRAKYPTPPPPPKARSSRGKLKLKSAKSAQPSARTQTEEAEADNSHLEEVLHDLLSQTRLLHNPGDNTSTAPPPAPPTPPADPVDPGGGGKGGRVSPPPPVTITHLLPSSLVSACHTACSKNTSKVSFSFWLRPRGLLWCPFSYQNIKYSNPHFSCF